MRFSYRLWQPCRHVRVPAVTVPLPRLLFVSFGRVLSLSSGVGRSAAAMALNCTNITIKALSAKNIVMSDVRLPYRAVLQDNIFRCGATASASPVKRKNRQFYFSRLYFSRLFLLWWQIIRRRRRLSSICIECLRRKCRLRQGCYMSPLRLSISFSAKA